MIRKAFAALYGWLCRHDGEAVYAEGEEISPLPPVVVCSFVKVLNVDADGSKLLALGDGSRFYALRLCPAHARLLANDLRRGRVCEHS